MGYVKTPEEIELINATLRNKTLKGERLEVVFLTDPETVARVLPPTLEPVDLPMVTARVSRWRTNYCGSFAMAGIYVRARHQQLEGEYILSMYINEDSGLLIGREDFGEPKKMARVELYQEPDEFIGTVERSGVELMRLRLSAGADVGPSTSAGVSFSVKATLKLGGGLQSDALVLASRGESDLLVNRPGTGALTLTSSPHDPVGDFAVREIVSAGYVVTARRAHRNDGYPELLDTIPAEKFLPFHYGRLDDWSAHNTLL